MINPDTLSRDQKRFLKERYDLDFDNPRPYRYLAIRVANLIGPWFNVTLGLGLLLETPSAGTVFPSQPFEMITWGLAAFGLFAFWACLIITWIDSRRATSSDENGKDVWSWLFRETIGFQEQWDVTTATYIGVGAMALLTGRIGVAVMWAAALLSLFAMERVFDDIVRAELVKIASRVRSPN